MFLEARDLVRVGLALAFTLTMATGIIHLLNQLPHLPQ